MYNVDNQAKDYLQTYSTVYPAVLSCGDWTGDGLIDCMLAGMHGTLQLAINSGPPFSDPFYFPHSHLIMTTHP